MRTWTLSPNIRMVGCLIVGCIVIWILLNTRREKGGVLFIGDGLHDAKIELIDLAEKLPDINKVRAMGKGLVALYSSFWIESQKTRLFSGAMHYFRIPRQYWRDRLMKLRASGCNVVETYVAWNVHEPDEGKFNFEGMLNLRDFIELAGNCGLYVIVRPGPYICSEWDLGGLPGWLLRDKDMKLRSSYEPFMTAVKRYFDKLLPLITDLQYSSGGGPIIAWQIENEYGSYGRDTQYLIQLKKIMEDNGVTELFFTSDNEQGLHLGAVPGALMTANFQEVNLGSYMLTLLEKAQPDMPRMVMEFWTGWFDHWREPHQVWPVENFESSLDYILKDYRNVNLYMFHGGTNFGFMNGANEQTINDQLKNGPQYAPDTSSYDYDAPISEDGRLTEKYRRVQELLSRYSSEVSYYGQTPAEIELPPPMAYDDVTVSSILGWEDLLSLAHKTELAGKALPMEMLPDYNQLYGWIVYEKQVEGGQLVIQGQVRDFMRVYYNDNLLLTYDCNMVGAQQIDLDGPGKLRMMVENQGRSNYQPIDTNVLNSQRKGFGEHNEITLDTKPLEGWTVYSLDFNSAMMARIAEAQFEDFSVTNGVKTPKILRASFTGTLTKADTFIDMTGWGKGILLLNGFNMGRYWSAGPTKTFYIPGPWIKPDQNEILIFEEESPLSTITFSDAPKLG